VDTLIDLAVAQARRGRRSVIFLIDQDDRDRCRQRLKRRPPELKKLIRVSNLAGNDLILEQVHEQIRVRRQAAETNELTAPADGQVD